MSRFKESFSEPLPFFEFDGEGLIGYALSREDYTLEEAIAIFSKITGCQIFNIEAKHVRFCMCNTSDGPRNSWTESDGSKGSKPIWWIEENCI